MRQLLEEPPSGWPLRWFLWDAALAYALCADAATSDEQLRAAYTAESIALLKRAIAGGFNDVPLLKTDPDLNPTRSSAEFRALVAELERKFVPSVELAPPPREVK